MKSCKLTHRILFILAALAAALLVAGCGGGIDVVDAGTYTGTIKEVKPSETEIYVTLDSGEQLELYFTESTELVANGNPVDFSELSQNMRVDVSVDREGNRNVPTRVVIRQQ